MSEEVSLMTRTATTPPRIINVFVLSVAAFMLVATDRALTQNAPLFFPPVTYSSGGEANNSVALGDVNSDGNLDIVAANLCVANCEEITQVGGFGVLLGNGDGTFQSAHVYSSLVSGNARSIALVDLNGDGKLDIVLSEVPLGDVSQKAASEYSWARVTGPFRQRKLTNQADCVRTNYWRPMSTETANLTWW
jgi:hypothetical protein